MKTLPQATVLAEEDTSAARTSFKVCMHSLGTAANDARVMREATALVKAGFDVSFVDVMDDVSRPGAETVDGVHIKHVFMPSWSVPTRFKPFFLVKAIWLIMRCIIKLLTVHADIYHAHDSKALPACYVVARLRRKPLIFDSHELPLDEPGIRRWRRLSGLARRVLARMIPRCAGVITTSPNFAREIKSEFRSPEITLVRNFPLLRPVPKTDRLRERLGLGADVRIALYQGNLQPNRTLDKLVLAAPLLNPNIAIVMMGDAVEETRVQLENLIASEGVTDRVKILPAVSYADLLNWTVSADIGLTILSPDYTKSVRFGLPNKFFEYLMAGLPVLTTNLDDIVEVIKTYDVGDVVPSLAPEDISQAINTLLADSAACARMHKNALEAARQEFHWEKESQNLIRLYQTILNK